MIWQFIVADPIYEKDWDFMGVVIMIFKLCLFIADTINYKAINIDFVGV
jgi:hypothetical protein